MNVPPEIVHKVVLLIEKAEHDLTVPREEIY